MKKFLKSVFTTAVGVLVGMLLVLIVIPVVLMLVFKGAQHGQVETIQKNSILHLKLDGAITDRHQPMDFDFADPGLFTDDHTLGLFEVNKALELAKKDERIVGLYLEIRGFSSGWANIHALRRSIKEFSDSGKWVYAYADGYDEMSYYLATSANQIFLQPYGEIELNGLAFNGAFFKGMLEKLEVQPQIFRAGKFKAAIEPLTRDDMSQENREQTQALVNDLWKTFRDDVSSATKLDPAKIDSIAAGLEVVSAADAKAAGLVHETLYVDVLEERMKAFTVGKENDLEFVTPGQVLRNYHVFDELSSGKKKVAVIFAEGEIVSGDAGREGIGSESLREDILDAKADENVAAIVLRINSPGGSALASDVLWRELRQTDDEIPVVVSMGDVAASGGYYLAAAGRYIYAEPTTITGSIGVFGVLMNAQKFFKSKAGVNFDRVVSHPYADIGSFTRSIQPKESEVIQKQVENVYKRFIDVVQEGRGYEKREDIEGISEGRVWSGVKAKEIGLVDELGGLDSAVRKAAEFAGLGADYDIEAFPRPTDPFRELFEKFSGEAMEVWFGKSGATQIRGLARVIDENVKPGVYTRLLFDFDIR